MDYAPEVERITTRIDQLNAEIAATPPGLRRDGLHRRRAVSWRNLADVFTEAGPATRALVQACSLAAERDETEAAPETHHARRMNPAAGLLRHLDSAMSRRP